VEAADHLAGGVEPLDRPAEDVEHPHPGVDGDPAVRREHDRARRVGVERRLLQRERLADTAGQVGPAERVALARRDAAVVVADGLDQRALGQPDGRLELLDGVAAQQHAGAVAPGELVDRDLVVAGRHHAGVEDLPGGHARLGERRVADLLVGQGLVDEAAALAVDRDRTLVDGEDAGAVLVGVRPVVDPIGPLDVRRVHDAGTELPGHQHPVAGAPRAARAQRVLHLRGEPCQQLRALREAAGRDDHGVGQDPVGPAGDVDVDADDPAALADEATRGGVEQQPRAQPAGRLEQVHEHAGGVGGVRAGRGLARRGVHLAVPHAVAAQPPVGLELVLAVEVDQRLVVAVLAGLEQVLAQQLDRVGDALGRLLVGAGVRREAGRPHRRAADLAGLLQHDGVLPGLRGRQQRRAPGQPRAQHEHADPVGQLGVVGEARDHASPHGRS